MSKNDQGKKLCQKIGIDQTPLSQSNCVSQHKQQSFHSVALSNKPSKKDNPDDWCEVEEISIVQSRGKMSQKSMEEGKSQADRFQKIMQALDVEVMQIEQNEPMEIMMEESRIEKVIETASMRSEPIEEGQSDYNEEISRMPQSITPLVYSKSSRPMEEIKFNKHHARLSLLKLTVTEAQTEIRAMKSTLIDFFNEIKSLQSTLQEGIYGKYQDLQRQYSLRLQESVFHHKQEFQQLRYQYEVLKGKEEITRTPVKSEFLIPEIQASEIMLRGLGERDKVTQLLKENVVLKEKVAELEQEREKIIKEASEFKRKISGIQSKTKEIRQSNDKLYQYIFDLEQQIAYHKEEIPKITKKIKSQLSQNYERQLQQMEEEKQHLLTKEEEVQHLIKNLEKEKKEVTERLQQTQSELTQLKINLQKKIDEQERLQSLCLTKEGEIKIIKKKQEQQEDHFKKLLEEKEKIFLENSESLKKIKNESPINSKADEPYEKNRERPRESIGKEILEIKDKEDKKWTEAMQIQRLVLQKQNVHLKAAVEFYSKTYGQHSQAMTQPLSPRQLTSYSIQNHYAFTQDRLTQTGFPDSSLQIKERQLQKYQNYLGSEAKKLESKQKQMESQYVIKKTLEQKHRDSNQSAQRGYDMNIQDDYGMKNVVTVNPRSYNVVPCVQQRRNQFCSRQAQAIIENVKMRQKIKDTSCHSHCQNSGNCRCDVLSRGSRNSRDSSSRDYYKMRQQRPQDTNPSARMNDYYRGQDKSSKMKMIEDKVKRLKSELKNSLSAMKS